MSKLCRLCKEPTFKNSRRYCNTCQAEMMGGYKSRREILKKYENKIDLTQQQELN